MKKIVWAFFALLMMAACAGKKEQTASVETVSATDTIESDTLNMEEAEEALPKRADELFDDFIFNFSKDRKVQVCRMVLPLPYVKNGKTTYIKKKEWELDPLFSNQEFYTVLYDNEQDMQLEKDTSLNKVTMEYLRLEQKTAKRYHFKRFKGVWVLFDIVDEPFNHQKDCVDFLSFYEHFANDSIYQHEHVHEPLKFITIDPDDDFNVIETTIEREQWFAFRPRIPKHTLTNINYGQKYQNNHQKILSIRGNGNGFNNTLTFERIDDRWMLTCFEDTSE